MASLFDRIARSIIGRDIGLDRNNNLLIRGSTIYLNSESANPTAITGTQAFSSNSVSHAPGAGPTNNYAPTGYVAGATNRLVLTPSAAASISGLLSPGIDGFSLLIVNLSATFAITFTHQDAGSAAANRFNCPGGASAVLAANAAAALSWVSGTGWVFS